MNEELGDQPSAEPDPADPAGPAQPEPGQAAAPAAGQGGLARLRGLSRTARIVYAGTAVVLAAVLAVWLSSSGPASARPGQPLARNFTMAELGYPGRQVSLSQFRGKPVIVNFFASWCGPCQKETPLIARFYRAMEGRVTVIGIDANDQTGPALRFVRAAGVRYLVGFDPGTAPVALAYGVYALPQTFFLNARHHIVSRILGAVTMKELSAGVAAMNERD
jgi:cytochrome c biogenesis protein CcmG/thiol:disulfide interchange protein DsbE